jgi:hypothetical protein
MGPSLHLDLTQAKDGFIHFLSHLVIKEVAGIPFGLLKAFKKIGGSLLLQEVEQFNLD